MPGCRGSRANEQDAFALRSHQRALAAIESGRFKDEIVPLTKVVDPRSAPNGNRPWREFIVRHRRGSAPRHVAGGARQAAPGLSRLRHGHRGQLVADERRRGGGRAHVSRYAKDHGLTPLARFVGLCDRRRRARAVRHRARARDQEGAEARRADARSHRSRSSSTKRSPRRCWRA